MPKITIGLPRIHQEPGERRDFLPEFIGQLVRSGAEVVLEHDYGSGMGFRQEDYLSAARGIRFAALEEVYRQEMVLVLRYPDENLIRMMQPGTCLVTMVHFPTRPGRVAFLRSLGIEAVSLDSIKDDNGRRLVENLRSVGWNGVEAAFQTLMKIFPAPGVEDPNRNPIKVTVMGAGAVGMFAIQAATRYGNEITWKSLAQRGATGVQVTAVEHDLTNHPAVMRQIVKYTDILVDATLRPDPGKPIILNQWIGDMRPHAVLLDLSVDPYECTPEGIQMVKGIEGIPQGNLDKYIFTPDDPAWDALPPCVDVTNRRWAISCYSWPGVHPRQCMEIYGLQLAPIFQDILESGGISQIRPDQSYFSRAVTRAMLSNWTG